jgi:hypothetical protein
MKPREKYVLEWRLVLIVHSDRFQNSIFPGGMAINQKSQDCEKKSQDLSQRKSKIWILAKTETNS